jgi:hypothetical protein
MDEKELRKAKEIEETAKHIAEEEESTFLDRWLIEKYLKEKNSGVYKVFKKLENNFVTKLLEYELIGGMTTGRFQKRVGAALNENPLEYTTWSIFFGIGVSLVKYLYAYLTEDRRFIGFTSDPVEWWGHILFFSNFYRYAYLKILKQPISAPYIWPISAWFFIKNKFKKPAK